MRYIKFKRVISVNNELKGHSSKNLLSAEVEEKGWWCAAGTEQGIVSLELECLSVITGLTIGNANSAFVEVLVGKVGDPTDSYQPLIHKFTFMNRDEVTSGGIRNRIKFFYYSDLIEDTRRKEWNVVHVICTQPFNKEKPFGLCFVIVKGLGDDLKVVEEKATEPEVIPRAFIREPPVKEKIVLTMADEMRKAERLLREKAGQKQTEASPRRRTRRHVEDTPEKSGNKSSEPEQSAKRRKISPKDKITEGNKGDSSKKKRKGPIVNPPFYKLMSDVTFAISGLKYPEKSIIKKLAFSMGARYLAEWNPRCSHFICSSMDVPKYKEAEGKSKVVRKEWVKDCHKDRKRYPWRRYAVNPRESRKEESEEEVAAEEADSSETEDEAEKGIETKKKKKKKKHMPDTTQDAGVVNLPSDTTVTDEDEVRDTHDLPMPSLPKLFDKKTFFVDGRLENNDVIERYIVGHGGEIMNCIERRVEYFVTEVGAIVYFIIRKKAPNVKAVRPSWIWKVISTGRWVSPDEYLLNPPPQDSLCDD